MSLTSSINVTGAQLIDNIRAMISGAEPIDLSSQFEQLSYEIEENKGEDGSFASDFFVYLSDSANALAVSCGSFLSVSTSKSLGIDPDAEDDNDDMYYGQSSAPFASDLNDIDFISDQYSLAEDLISACSDFEDLLLGLSDF